MIPRLRLFISRNFPMLLPPVGEWDAFNYQMRRLTPTGDWEYRDMTPDEIEEENRARVW